VPAFATAPEARVGGVRRWLKLVVGWNLAVLVICAGYILLLRTYENGFLWVAPPVAALFGGAICLQLGAGRIAREALR